MRRLRRLGTLLVIVGWLAGCAVGPDYKRPEILAPTDWRNGPEGRDSLGDLGWWELFKDPALHELISAAVVANRDLQVAVARVLDSRAQLGVARAAQFPQVKASGSYEYTRPFSKNSPMLRGGETFTGDDWQAGMDLTFELDLWGRLRRGTEAARAELLASGATRRVVPMTRRPDIRQAEQTLVAANARIGRAKAEYFPKISLTGMLGVESVSLSDLFAGGSRFWSIGPTMTVPLFTAGRTSNTVKGFEARQQQAATQYLQTIQQAFREVEDALIFHRKVREIRTERERRVAATRRAPAVDRGPADGRAFGQRRNRSRR